MDRGDGAEFVAFVERLKIVSTISLQKSRKSLRFAMKVIIHLTKEEEAKALPILLRHSPGMVLPHRTYVLSEDTLMALRRADIRCSELSRDAVPPSLEEVAGERV